MSRRSSILSCTALLFWGEDTPPTPVLEPAHHGAAVSTVGDCDLDGSDDVIVGAYWSEAQGKSGSATVFSGKTGKVLYTVRGREAGSLFGLAVGSAGDTNDDSAADFVVGAPLEKRKGKAVGVVRVYSGRDGSLLHEIEGKQEGEQFGFSVQSAGDVDQDGFDELVVGSPGARVDKKATTGAARVFAGKDARVVYEWFGDADGDRFGWSVSGAGDCDVDGSGDVVVGAWGGEYARVFQGRKGEVLLELRGSGTKDRFGWSVGGAGDTNQDGASDIVVGSPWGEPVGARAFSGKKKAQVLLTFDRDTKAGEEGWSYGASVDGAGDVNADGFFDIVVGDPGFPKLLSDAHGQPLNALLSRAHEKVARPGRVYVYDGHKGALLHKFEGAAKDDWFGVSVGTAGDVDQDGFDDVLVGAGRDAPFQARIYSGQSGKMLRELKVE